MTATIEFDGVEYSVNDLVFTPTETEQRDQAPLVNASFRFEASFDVDLKAWREMIETLDWRELLAVSRSARRCGYGPMFASEYRWHRRQGSNPGKAIRKAVEHIHAVDVELRRQRGESHEEKRS